MSENQSKGDDILTIRLSRRTVTDLVSDAEDHVAMLTQMHEKNPHYPTIESMWEAFPHHKEQYDAFKAALASDSRA